MFYFHDLLVYFKCTKMYKFSFLTINKKELQLGVPGERK
jgi:hypothetical protein